MKKAIFHSLSLLLSLQEQGSSVNSKVKSLSSWEVAEGLIKNPDQIDPPEYDLRQIGNHRSVHDRFQSLVEQSQFEANFDWNPGTEKRPRSRGKRLAVQSQMSDHCDFSSLDRTQNRKILLHQIHFCNRAVLSKFTASDRDESRKRYPEVKV